MVILTFVTGIVDAVGFLGLDRVFTGNMTGNIVILGMGFAGADDLPILGPMVALAAFTGGAWLAGRVLRTHDSTWSLRITLLLSGGAATFTVLAITFAAIGPDSTEIQRAAMAGTTAAVMGAQACVARKLAIKDMTTVVVTSTLTSLASESFLAGGLGAVWNRRVGAIVSILAGAMVGALALKASMSLAMGIAAVLTIGVAVAGHAYLRAEEDSAS